jgi:hypothetical protein
VLGVFGFLLAFYNINQTKCICNNYGDISDSSTLILVA